jgi:hypothetical protein
MPLRAAIVMLVLLNLGAALWWRFAPPPPPPPALEGPELRLLSEATSSAPAAQTPAAAPVGLPGQAARPPVCVRLGPFADAASRQTARTALRALGVEAQPVGTPAPARGGWKVFLPPQPSREAAQALVDRLRAAGVEDVGVLTAGKDANAIALGLFSSEAGARRRLQALAALGVSAQLAPVQPAATGWLDARLPDSVDPEHLTLIAPARPLDCAQLPEGRPAGG